jgi:hypothetical protein
MPTAFSALDYGKVCLLFVPPRLEHTRLTDTPKATVIGKYIYLDGGEISNQDTDSRSSNPSMLHPEPSRTPS